MFRSEEKKDDSNKVSLFLKTLTLDSIKECKDAPLLVDALIIKLKEMIAATFAQIADDIMVYKISKERGTLYYKAPELLKRLETAEDRFTQAQSKYDNVMKALNEIKQNNSFNQEQQKLLDEYKNEFAGPLGQPSRTSLMFTRILQIVPEKALSCGLKA